MIDEKISITPEQHLAELFKVIGQPARLKILLIIGTGEACVCHIKAALNARQPYVSQQLMVLREADLVTTNREGRNIYYRLKNPELLQVIKAAARLNGLTINKPDVPDITGCPYRQCV